MSKIMIDSKKGTAEINFDASEQALAKIIISFLPKEAILPGPAKSLGEQIKRLGASMMAKKLQDRRINQIKLDLNSAAVSKQVILAMLGTVDKIK